MLHSCPLTISVAARLDQTGPNTVSLCTSSGAPLATLAPFAHFGIELPTREDVDEMAERGKQAGCLAMPPTMMPQPIGYITMLRDPDGNMVEFSWDQGVFSTLHELWSQAD